MTPVPSCWRRPAVLGWAIYDWANSAFALAVMTTFVPVMLGGLWNDGAVGGVVTFRLGLANGVASLLVALLVPLLGAVADRSGRRRLFLLLATLLGSLSTILLAGVGAGQWRSAAALYMLASIAFAAGNALYDSLLVDVAAPAEYDSVSAFGYALGYLGGALLLTIALLMAAYPAVFGWSGPEQAVRFSFILVGAWWVIFSVPLMLWVRDDPAREGGPGSIVAGFGALWLTLREARSRPALWRFLLAYWLYIDAVYTIIKMAVDFGVNLGLASRDLIFAILLTNFVAFPAALGFGWLAGRIGARRGLYLGLAVYVGCTLAAVFIDSATEFYLLAGAVGLVQGGVQSLSRSMFAGFVPPGRAGEYFGFYNMLGKFAAILGPILTGSVALATGSQRLGIVSLLALFLSGVGLLAGVRESPARMEQKAG